MARKNDPNVDRWTADGWANCNTGVGTSRDRGRGTYYGVSRRMTQDELTYAYQQNALVARVVDLPVDEATAPGWRLETPDDFDGADLIRDLEDIGTDDAIANAWRWARLYRGCIAIMDIDDGGDLSEPLALDRVRSIRGYSIVESEYATPADENGSVRVSFSPPDTYVVTTGDVASGMVVVHASRVLRFDAARMSPGARMLNDGWGASIVERCFDSLSRLGEAEGYGAEIMRTVSVRVAKMAGFAKACAAGKRSAAVDRITQMQRDADVMGLLVIGEEDEVTETSRNVSGIDALITRYESSAVRDTGIPKVKLLGEGAAGLNASSEGELRTWSQRLASDQDDVLRPAYNRVVEISMAARRNTGQEYTDDWTVEFNPVGTPTEAELSAAEKTRAEAASLRILSEVSSVEEERERLTSRGDIVQIEGAWEMLPEPMLLEPEIQQPPPPEDDGDDLDTGNAEITGA